MKVAVIGLGEFGRTLVVHLARAGAEVIAADLRMEPVEDVRDEAAVAVRLDGTDEKDLRSQGIHEVDALVAAMGQSFESTILVTVAAKRLGIRRVIARAENLTHARVLSAVGADLVVVPLRDAAAALGQRILTPGIRNYLELADGVSLVEVEAPASFHGKTVAALSLRRKHGVNLVAIRRRRGEEPGAAEEVNPVPSPEDRLAPGDVLAVAGRAEAIAAFLRAAR
jgi:trk system potassium uptake protein TrkA